MHESKRKLPISIITVLYNEESKVEGLLKNFKWSNEVIVLEKHSTDRTKEIALRYTDKVYSIPFTTGADGYHIAVNYVTNEWIYHVSASGLIHPKLVDRLSELIQLKDFPFDVIELPYKIFAFGIHSKYSPWFTQFKPTVIRKSAFRPSEELHKEASFESNRIYRMPWGEDDHVQYHLTHKDMDNFFEKHMRYTKYEAEFIPEAQLNKALKRAAYEIIKSVGIVLLKRKSFMFGWNGLALALAYVSYFIMKFLYIWDRIRERQNGNFVYPELKNRIVEEWDKVRYD